MLMYFKNLISYSRSLNSNSRPTAVASLAFHNFKPTPLGVNFYYNRMINNFLKSGFLDSAVQLFDEMPDPDVISWNLIIAGHARYGFPEKGLHLFKNMVFQGIEENPMTFSSILGICRDAGFYREGLQVHCRVINFGFDSNLFIGSALVDLYMRIGYLDIGLRLFDELPERNLATWNLVMRGLCGSGRAGEMVGFFSKMKFEGVDPNAITLSYLIRGCSNEGLLDQGRQLHCFAIKLGWFQSNLFVANAFVDLYSACGCLIDSRKSFQSIPVDEVISWNSIISVHTDNGYLLEALEFFDRMRLWNKKPSIRTFVGFLNLLSWTQNLLLGEQIHGFVLKLGFDLCSVHIRSALIDMYGKCGQIRSSVLVFEEIIESNLECYNSLITSLLCCGIVEDAVEMFGLMTDEGVRPDHVTLSATLKASSSSSSASLSSCQLLHCCIVKSGFESNIVVLCSLIDAYSKSGHIELSHCIFQRILSPNVICYTAMITGCARNGMGKEGLEKFDEMNQKGLKPDAITFLSVLTGCDHSGLVKEGMEVFESMKRIHGVDPDRRHYSCMVNLLGRAGLLEEVEQLLKLALVDVDCIMLSSLLRSCRVHGNEDVGKRVANALIELETEDRAVYLQVLSFYSEIGDRKSSGKVREMMEKRNMRRDIGYSMIEVND